MHAPRTCPALSAVKLNPPTVTVIPQQQSHDGLGGVRHENPSRKGRAFRQEYCRVVVVEPRLRPRNPQPQQPHEKIACSTIRHES
eukprot:scaffold12350_cov171-Amphora_coffeaeformis.AAC.2